ncbi:hypothetical protein MLD52_05865 [Puniceicoccaceae bacterium K14]|nr:hypothetical protein [Puniceicoccaceae bacterium K14]
MNFRSFHICFLFLVGTLHSVVVGKVYDKQQSPGLFEGSLSYVISYYSLKSGKVLDREKIVLAINEERLLFPSLIGDLELGSLIPPGVDSALVRNDKKDIVLFGESYDAYRVKSFDMTMLGMVMKGMAFTDTPTNLPEPKFVGKFELRGKRTELWQYESKEGFRMDLYLSGDFQMNWGLLTKSWLFGAGGLNIRGLADILKTGKIPVRVDAFENEKRFVSLNLMGVKERSVPEELLNVPNPKVLHSVTQLLLEAVR